MGRPKKNTGKRKNVAVVGNSNAEDGGSVHPQYVEWDHLEGTEHESTVQESPLEPVNEEGLNEVEPVHKEVSEEGMRDELQGKPRDENESNEPVQPQRKRQRGPTKMKDIAKDPNTRVRVDFTHMGEACGPGSVKLSSYVGSLVREHVPIIIDDWRKVSNDLRTVLWKSVQASELFFTSTSVLFY